MVGSLAGWVLELFYRGFVSQKKLVNPGFLAGPYLPLYGFGVVILYLLSLPDIHIALRIPFFFFIISLLEYLTGLFFLLVFQLRLWDYRKKLLNIQGLVCPEFSIYWTILSTLFFFFIVPQLDKIIELSQSLYVSYFIIGVFIGLMGHDMIVSFNLAFRLKKMIKKRVERERELAKSISSHLKSVDLKQFKVQLRAKSSSLRSSSRVGRFFAPFSTFKNSDIKEQLETYFATIHSKHKKK